MNQLISIKFFPSLGFLTFKFLTTHLATKLYVSIKVDVTRTYKRAVRTTLNSSTELNDFSNPVQAAKKMNNWVAKSTKNLITEIIDPNLLNEETVLILINCIYFKADWLSEFRKSSTRNATFNCINGEKKSVSFMSRTGFYQFSQNVEELGNAMAVRLNYKNSNSSMIFIMPKKSQTIQSWLKNTRKINWTLVDEQMPAQGMVNVTIPKFNITTFKIIDENIKKVIFLRLNLKKKLC